MRFPITHTLDLYHLTKVSGKVNYPANADESDIEATVQPAGGDIISVFPDVPAFQMYVVYIYNTDVTIKNGDKLTDGTDTFIIKDVAEVFRTAYLSYQRVLGQKEAL